ncbi:MULTISPECIES: bifunctional diguanylate cyclase/phosphodiesterase [Paraliobacillus]|uniref:sensor domain-containing protein n=1 Tax=Paraliobacillus TaxID=200903 RepID=UPI000DD4C63F|nr:MULTISPECIES: bifunctional diguanylate cyclase/phosphodiesterase [Paraliobacillus]
MTIYPVDNVSIYQKLETLIEQLQATSNKEDIKEIALKIETYLKTGIQKTQALNGAVSEAFRLMIIDQKGYITYIDDDFCEQLGYEKEELLYHHYRTLHAGVHDASFYESMWITVESGKVWQGDICTETKKGAMVWYRTKLVPLVDPTNHTKTFAVFRTYIDDIKKDETQLVEALNDDYHKVFQQLMNLVFRVQKNKQSGEYRFSLIEGKLTKKLAIYNDYTYDQPLDAVFGTTDHECIIEKFDRVYAGEEVTFKHQHGSLYLYSMLSPIMENGEVIEVVGSSVDITSLEEAEQQIRHLAFHDPLTDLPNRSKLREDMKSLVKKAEQSSSFAVLYCDIDRLKYINDTLGEFIGDQVIQTIAKRLENTIDDKGKLYRFGGDEFVALIEGSKTEINLMSKALLNQIKQPLTLHGNEFFVTCSIGISFFGDDATTADELMNHASIAVHYCKVNGRNSRLVYTPSMDEMYNDILLMEGEIRKALYHDDFQLYYQPQINVETGEVIALEALIRWSHKEKGFIPPSEFIPLAEEIGVIIQLGEWVVRQACMQHVKWVEKGYKPVRIAVNVSAIELQRFDFADQVAMIIQQTNMDPNYLEIEITENSVMQNTEDCIKTMNTLRAMGISLSIDDFGTGYSSFGYLRKFPINYLKIDQSFVKNALTESSSAEIIKAMIQIAHTFGLKVVAEGVEEQKVLDLLQNQECDYYQGYFFSKPVPADALERLLYKKTS